ncbi:MAG: DUF2500 family protein [Clostridia bacterium]|nr:DUF2500 family protein [Clostridia bacterium]
MEEALNNIVGWIIPAFVGLIWVLYIVKLIRSRYSSVKTVKAKLVEKYQYKPVSRYNTGDMYVIVFEAEGKKLSFKVSKFSYNSYKVKKNGTLKHKGEKIISFE